MLILLSNHAVDVLSLPLLSLGILHTLDSANIASPHSTDFSPLLLSPIMLERVARQKRYPGHKCEAAERLIILDMSFLHEPTVNSHNLTHTTETKHGRVRDN